MTGAEDPGPSVIVDPLTGRPILMAPVRRLRPVHTVAGRDAGPCPFCPGNELETPAEIDAVRNGAGWSARAFANKYPASEHHEVVAEGARHVDQPCDLELATLRDALALWQRRIAALERLPGVGCTFLFKNVGAAAGASIAHNHSQILGLAAPPPRLLLEAQHAARLDACPWCRTLATAETDGRLVFASAGHAVVVPDPPKLPHESWLLPLECDDDFLTTDLDSLASALQAMFRAVSGALGRPAFNFWLHRLPRERFHWHFELQPRTGQVAGLELGGDMYINSFPAVAAAARLREGLREGRQEDRQP